MSEVYTVILDYNGMPNCNCFKWQKELMPCKHIFAVLYHMHSMDWTKLPAQYRNCPWFTIDSDCRLICDSSEQPGQNNFTEKATESEEASTPSLSLGTEVRDILKALSSDVYLLTESKDLEHLKVELRKLHEFVQKKTRKQDGIDLLPSMGKHRRKLKKTTRPRYQEKKYEKLSFRKKLRKGNRKITGKNNNTV